MQIIYLGKPQLRFENTAEAAEKADGGHAKGVKDNPQAPKVFRLVEKQSETWYVLGGFGASNWSPKLFDFSNSWSPLLIHIPIL